MWLYAVMEPGEREYLEQHGNYIPIDTTFSSSKEYAIRFAEEKLDFERPLILARVAYDSYAFPFEVYPEDAPKGTFVVNNFEDIPLDDRVRFLEIE